MHGVTVRACNTSTKWTRVVMEGAVVKWRPCWRPLVLAVSSIPRRRVFCYQFRLYTRTRTHARIQYSYSTIWRRFQLHHCRLVLSLKLSKEIPATVAISCVYRVGESGGDNLGGVSKARQAEAGWSSHQLQGLWQRCQLPAGSYPTVFGRTFVTRLEDT